MARQLTTDTSIRKWVVSRNEETYSCGNRMGLYIRGYLTGRKSFYWRDGTWVKLGDYPEMTLASARELVVTCKKYRKAEISVKDIAAALAISTEMSRLEELLQKCLLGAITPNASISYGDVFTEWYERNAPKIWQDGPSRRRPLAMHLNWVPEELKAKPIHLVQRHEIFRVIQRMFDEVPVSAPKQLGYMDRVFEYAINSGYNDNNPCPPRRAFEAVAPEKKHHGYLPYQRMPELWRWLDTRGFNFETVMALKTIMLTGHRVSVVAQAKWEDIDNDNRIWTIPRKDHSDKTTTGRMKSGREFTVVFPEAFFALLLKSGNRTGFVFQSPTTAGHITPNALLKGFKAFDASITAHGFRNTIKTWARSVGVEDYLADNYVDHSLTGLDKSYRREDLSEKRSQLTQKLFEYCESRYVD